ncbi:hypothetical protein BH23ACT2_BH23ACT2_05360 [soil metagenome]
MANRPPSPERAAPGPDPAARDGRQRPTGRGDRLRQAAIAAEQATGVEEPTAQRAQRNVVLRVVTIVVGFAVLLGGLAMIVLPGPGILGVLAGLGILSRELPWAERLIEHVKRRAKIDELKAQPAWVQVAMWTVTVAAIAGSIVYLTVIR